MRDVIIERVYLYVSTIFRGSLAHGLQTTCDDDEDCSSNITTDFNFLYSTSVYYFVLKFANVNRE